VPEGRLLWGGRRGCRVGHPLHGNTLSPPTRCDPRLAAPARDWRGFKQLVAAHGEPFQPAPPRDQTASDEGLGAQRRGGGPPETLGEVADRGLPCGQGQPLGSLRGQSSLGWRCATVCVAHWGSPGSKVLHAGVLERPSIRTVPAMCRTTFSQPAAGVVRARMRGGAQGLDACESAGQGQALRGGAITGLPTPGRHGQAPPHWPVLAPSGGDEEAGGGGDHGGEMPAALLRRPWQGPLRTMRRQTLQTEALHQVGGPWCRTSPNGCVRTGPKGHVPSQEQSVARSGAQDGVRPPRAVRRLARYEGERVTAHARSPRTARRAPETVATDTVSGRLMPQTRPQGGQRLRSDGGPATKTFARGQVVRQAAWAQGEGVSKGALQSLARLPSRPREAPSTGRDPCRCPSGPGEREVGRLGHPTSGVLEAEGEGSKRGTEAATAQRAGP
jgi:hypothetical protein